MKQSWFRMFFFFTDVRIYLRFVSLSDKVSKYLIMFTENSLISSVYDLGNFYKTSLPEL